MTCGVDLLLKDGVGVCVEPPLKKPKFKSFCNETCARVFFGKAVEAKV
jgi:hypothetical protein